MRITLFLAFGIILLAAVLSALEPGQRLVHSSPYGFGFSYVVDSPSDNIEASTAAAAGTHTVCLAQDSFELFHVTVYDPKLKADTPELRRGAQGNARLELREGGRDFETVRLAGVPAWTFTRLFEGGEGMRRILWLEKGGRLFRIKCQLSATRQDQLGSESFARTLAGNAILASFRLR